MIPRSTWRQAVCRWGRATDDARWRTLIFANEIDVTSRVNKYLSDEAFRNIALGENYFRLLGLDYTAPKVCPPKAE